MGEPTPTPEISITPPEEPAGFPLTKEFLEIAFEKEVESFEINVGTNPGDNYLSIIHAVEVLFLGESEAQHYLIKCYPNHPGRREFLDQINVFEKELFMYSELLQELESLARESGAEELIPSIPPFHGGNIAGSPCEKFHMEPWSSENFLIMTDLRKKLKFKMANRVAGLDWDHATLTLKEIAKLHALTWAYKQKQGLKLLSHKYPDVVDRMYNNKQLIDSFQSVMDRIQGNAKQVVDEALGSDHPASKNFKSFLEVDLMDMMLKSLPPDGIDEDLVEGYLRVKPKDDNDSHKTPWLVGTHGDCWVNNMLFQYDANEPSKPVKVVLVDFQVFREACPTLDLAYFISSSIRAKIRIPREDEILQVYHDAFLSNCKALKVEPLPGFTMDNLRRKYRRSTLFGLGVSLPLLSFVLKPPEESTDLDKDEGENMSDLFSSVLEGSEKNARLRNELGAMVLDLYEKGVI